MKKVAWWIVAMMFFSAGFVLAEEPTTKFDLKNFDYCPACDEITFSGDADKPVAWSELRIRHKSVDDVKIVVDEKQKQVIVQGFEESECAKEKGFYKKVILNVLSEEEKTVWLERLNKFKEKHKNYLASQDSTQKKKVEEFPLTAIDFHTMYGTIQFGVVECGGDTGRGSGFMDHYIPAFNSKAQLRDDGLDYVSVQIIHHDTSSKWVANLEAIILVPNKEDEIVWNEALTEWNSESNNFHVGPNLFNKHRVLPNERVSVLKEKNKAMGMGMTDHYQEDSKCLVKKIANPELMSPLLEFNVGDWQETYYALIDNIEVKVLTANDLPKNERPDVLRGELFVEFCGKNKLYPEGFHYKKAIIYVKPEAMEDWKKKIGIYKEAYLKYSSKK